MLEIHLWLIEVGRLDETEAMCF